MKSKKAVSLAIALLGCGNAYAQSYSNPGSYNPSWYVSPSLNLMDPDSAFGVDKRGEGLGLRFGKPTSPDWDIQLGGAYARATQNGSSYSQFTLGADALYMFSRSNIRPFLLIGAGAERDKLSGNIGNRSKTSPFIEAGFGAQLSFNDQWSAQVDLRRVHGYLRDNTFGFNRSDNNYLTVGLTYTFDKPAAPAPVVAQRAAPAYVPPPAPVYVAPAPEPRPVVVAPPPVPRFERVTLSATELFGFDSATLLQPQPKLDDVAAALNGNMRLSNIDVVGYTDRLGSNAYNKKLSQQRADSVKNYLVGKGVAASRLRAEGRGEASPVVTCTDKNRTALIECLAPNRRVEVEQITIERRVN